ncbi:MAG: CarD family transcriptional regulator [Ruminiclostridium sp.]|nr:CarD family transcriptional regulator [Ruminiclostridium sp.]
MNAANFSVNDYVVYKGVGVCRIEAVENKTFDDVNYEDYFKLVPLDSVSSSYFIPVNAAKLRLRRPMTEDEVNTAIDNSAGGEINLCPNTRERRNAIELILKEGDCTRIISLIKTIYLFTQDCRSSGRKVLVSDENALRMAENMIYPEFSFVLGIDQNEVAGYIGRRLENAGV